MARTTSSIMMALGTSNMWGFSPSFDLQDGIAHATDAHAPLEMLLIGPGDVRHVLETIARRRQRDASAGSTMRPLHIYIYEHTVEALARHLLLLHIAQDRELPMRQRCHTFLEVYGNVMVQERTSAYIAASARQLMELVHNERGPLADIVDLSHLKMRTRDELVETFGSWMENVAFDVVKLRDHRLRHYYEARYDCRNNLIDWDYTMKLKRIEDTSVIHIRQFRDWRNTGIAFEFGDQTYTVPNRTMASYSSAHKRGHGTVLCRGLWTDIVIGPFVSFGVRCDRAAKFADLLFEVHNRGTGVEQNRHNTVEVAVYNLLSYMSEIESGHAYEMKKAHDIYSGLSAAEKRADDNQQSEEDASAPRFEEVSDTNQASEATSGNQGIDPQQQTDTKVGNRTKPAMCSGLEGVKIILLTGKLDDILTKKRYQQRFNHVFLSSQHTHVMHESGGSSESTSASITSVLADEAAVSIESSIFMLPLTDDQRVAYATKILEMARTHHLQPHPSISEPQTKQDLLQIKNAVLRFSFARPRDA